MSYSDWKYLGGSSRQYRNEKTGEVISRRQYDKRFGSLKKRGVTSYEKGAKLSAPEVVASRPAKGRGKANISLSGVSRAGPLASKRGGTYSGRTFYDGDQPETYDELLAALKKNGKIWDGIAGAEYNFEGKIIKKFFANKFGQPQMSKLGALIDGDTAEFNVINGVFGYEPTDGSESGSYDNFSRFFFTVRYKREYIVEAPKHDTRKRTAKRVSGKTKKKMGK